MMTSSGGATAPEMEKMKRERQAGPEDDDIATAQVIPKEVAQLHPGLHLYAPVASDLEAESQLLIVGSDFHQMLQIVLKPGQLVTAEPGCMTMMSGALQPGIESGGCGPACRRCCFAGESFFRLTFENKTQVDQFIAISPPQPGKIIPINLDRYNGITLTPGSFLGALGRSWDYNIKTVRNVGTGCCGGQGFFLSELHGSGTAFIHAMGTVETIQLHAGEEIVLENSALVAFERGVTYDIRQTGGCLVCCCGKMGLFNVVLKGPGLVIAQSLSLKRLRAALRIGGGGRSNNDGTRAGRRGGGIGMRQGGGVGF